MKPYRDKVEDYIRIGQRILPGVGWGFMDAPNSTYLERA